MALIESQSQTENPFASNWMMPDLATFGRKSVEQFTKVQTELLEKFQATNKHWLDRFQVEADLWSEFRDKLSAARTTEEVAAACQKLATRHVEMAQEDARHMVADGQAMFETATRLLSNGHAAPGKGTTLS